MKAYNFPVCPVAYPFFNGPQHPALVAPFVMPEEAIVTKFYDKRNPGIQYTIKLLDRDLAMEPDTVLVQSLKDVLDRYPYTPEKKLVDRYGEPCSRSTIGVQHHQSITFNEVKYVGKEVNFLEERDAGLIEPEDLLNIFVPDEWIGELLPQLQKYRPGRSWLPLVSPTMRLTGTKAGYPPAFV